jgi:hypothetical protein
MSLRLSKSSRLCKIFCFSWVRGELLPFLFRDCCLIQKDFPSQVWFFSRRYRSESPALSCSPPFISGFPKLKAVMLSNFRGLLNVKTITTLLLRRTKCFISRLKIRLAQTSRNPKTISLSIFISLCCRKHHSTGFS